MTEKGTQVEGTVDGIKDLDGLRCNHGRGAHAQYALGGLNADGTSRTEGSQIYSSALNKTFASMFFDPRLR